MPVSVLITPEFSPSPAIEVAWMARLPAARRAEISRWVDGTARRRSLLGSRLLAEGLRRLGHPASALDSLCYPPQSRPTLALPVEFSLSHCEGRIVCALSTSGPVGVDVERLDGLTAGDFRLYFSAAERAWAGRSERRFCAVWTRKEAVAKAAGSRGLRDVSRVDTMSGAGRAVLDGRSWWTPAVPVGGGHVAHLALADEAAGVTFEQVGRTALERGFEGTGGDHAVSSSRVVL
jgi:4'-phosphopantetheinyl transferase